MVKDNHMKIATVTELFEIGTAKITFFGEDVPSEKEYSYLSSFVPQVGDTVLLIPLVETYVIAGKIMFKEEPLRGITEENIQQIISPILEDYATKNDVTEELYDYVKATILENYAPVNHIHISLNDSGYRVGFIHTINGVPHFAPTSQTIGLGTSTYKWKEIYATTSTISTSDATKKKEIEELDDRYLNLLLSLNPIRYKLNDGESDRYHTGYISQDVEKNLNTIGLSDKDFAGFIKSQSDEGESEYGLRYEEFGALYAKGIQTLFKMVSDLKSELEELKKGASYDTGNAI